MRTTRCLMCNRAIGTDVAAYERHLEKFHSLDGYNLKVKPVRTTDRTKAQIVSDMEKGSLAAFIIEPDERAMPVPAIVPASYCGVGGKVCVWEDNGWEICGPCSRVRSAKLIAESRLMTFPNGAGQ